MSIITCRPWLVKHVPNVYTHSWEPQQKDPEHFFKCCRCGVDLLVRTGHSYAWMGPHREEPGLPSCKEAAMRNALL